LLLISAPERAAAIDTCQINFDVLRNTEPPRTTAEWVEQFMKVTSAKASNVKIAWALQEFETAELLPLSQFFGGQGHLFEVKIEEEASTGLPYRLLEVLHHGRGRTPLSTLSSSYLVKRWAAGPSGGYRLSPRSFLIWYSEEGGIANATCFSGPNSARLHAAAERQAYDFQRLDSDLRKHLEFLERAAAWDALAHALGKAVSDTEIRDRLAALDQSRREISDAWRSADATLQRELARQRRLRSDAGFIAIMGTLLSAAQLANALSSQAMMSPAETPYNQHRPIRTQINEALITSGNSITRIRTEIVEYEKRLTSVESDLRKAYREAGVPNKSIP
jgi:hypothetical protein